MTTGVVLSVGPTTPGDTLAVTTAPTDTVIQLEDTGDFANEDDLALDSHWLTFGDSAPLRYVVNDEDAETLTLDEPVGEVFEAGLPVRMWDATVKPDGDWFVEYVAQVRLDEQPDAEPVPAVVRDDKVMFADFDDLLALTGARVVIAQDEDAEYEDEWFVSEVLGRAPRIDPNAVLDPALTAQTAALQQIPHATPTVVTGWLTWEKGGWTQTLDSSFVAPRRGRYLVTFGARWESNSSGRRDCWLRVHTFLGTFDQFRDTRAAAGNVATSTQAVATVTLSAGERVDCMVRQDSGASLGLRAGSAETFVSIVRMGDL